jgi:hypothetical protein
MVLLSLGLVAALTVGGSFVTRRFLADGRQALNASELEPALESSLIEALGHVDSTVLGPMSVGETRALGSTAASIRQPTVTAIWVTRVSDRQFALIGEVSTVHKPLQTNRLMLATVLDSLGLRPIRMRPWTRLP